MMERIGATAFILLICAVFVQGPSLRDPAEGYESVCTEAKNEHCFISDRDSCQPGYHKYHQYSNTCKQGRPCCPCEINTYQPQYNKCFNCIVCKNCTKKGLVEEFPCNITHDAVCGDELQTTSPKTDGPQSSTNQPSMANDPSSTDESPTSTKPSAIEQNQSTTIAPTAGTPRNQVRFEQWWLICTHLLCLMVPCIFFTWWPSTAQRCHDMISSFWQRIRWKTSAPGRYSQTTKKGRKQRSKTKNKQKGRPSQLQTRV